MKRILLFLGLLVLGSVFVLSISTIWPATLERYGAESADDGQEARGLDPEDPGTVEIHYTYIELQNNPLIKRWMGGMRFPNVTIPQGATINSCVIKVRAYAGLSWIHAYDSVACEDVDSATIIPETDFNLRDRWENRTTNWVLWHKVMSASAINPDSTPDLKTTLQEVVDRPNWKSGNAVMFLFWNIWDTTDSAAYECYSWDSGDHTLGGKLCVDYTVAEGGRKLILWRK